MIFKVTQFATGSKQYHNDNYISALTLLYFFRAISNFGKSEETSKSQETEHGEGGDNCEEINRDERCASNGYTRMY